jgi:hypothetical protein
VGVEVPNARYVDGVVDEKEFVFTLSAPVAFWRDLADLFKVCVEKKNRYLDLRMDLPRKPKSTGRGSANNHFGGHARQIASQTGDDVEHTRYWIMVRAEKRGYPVHHDKWGNPIPQRWSKASSAEASYAIEQSHEDAAFLGMTLIEKAAW